MKSSLDFENEESRGRANEEENETQENAIRSLISQKAHLFCVRRLQKHPKEGVMLKLRRLNNKSNEGQKEKSLMELSCDLFSLLEGSENNCVDLEQITKLLGVERRRVYDIINILEGLGIVLRKGKNSYLWKGLTQMESTIEYVFFFLG